jgi:hypothetical protein
MTRCHCEGSGPWARGHRHDCRHCHGEDTRWAVPGLGVLLALAAVGMLREHGRGAEQAVRDGGYTVFALSVAAVVILIAVRARRRARDRRPPAQPREVITGTARAGLPGAGGRQAIDAPPLRLERPASSRPGPWDRPPTQGDR